MIPNDPENVERTDLDERDLRAATQYLTVIEEAPDLYSVTSQSGRQYVVDTAEGRCSCPDHEYRGTFCKHARRVLMELGKRPIPEGVDADALPSDFGEHVEAETDPNAGAPVATDGGQALSVPEGYSLHVETPEQGGQEYHRCVDCGAELLVSLGAAEKMVHREGCSRQ